MEAQGRHVVLLSDNCPSHTKFNQDDYPNVQIIFFQPKMTSHLQPMDAGIIRTFKAIYKRFRIHRILQQDEAGEDDIYSLSQLDAMNMATEAWSQISCDTIKNCWKHTGILGDQVATPKLQGAEPMDMVETAVVELDDTLKKLTVSHIGPRDLMTANEWLDLPEEEVTKGAWSDTDII